MTTVSNEGAGKTIYSDWISLIAQEVESGAKFLVEPSSIRSGAEMIPLPEKSSAAVAWARPLGDFMEALVDGNGDGADYYRFERVVM